MIRVDKTRFAFEIRRLRVSRREKFITSFVRITKDRQGPRRILLKISPLRHETTHSYGDLETSHVASAIKPRPFPWDGNSPYRVTSFSQLSNLGPRFLLHAVVHAQTVRLTATPEILHHYPSIRSSHERKLNELFNLTSLATRRIIVG